MTNKTKLTKGWLSKITSLDEESLIATKALGLSIIIISIGAAVGLAMGIILAILKFTPEIISLLK